ncbi:hypothetical protein [Streptomyces sp. SID8499]|uniref:hypothetical protein n=1 Tax=Streptomyces sp. SID8499 TaxID=2706106 RepID=UPI0013CA5D99|nr:hypothetical protein [Streptomyces sp. SID8499]NED31089.1 hypothetical protein [Streptomyces sp. SID8499]
MHDHTPTDDGYEWPTCAAGPDRGHGAHTLWADELDRLVCRPCETKTARRIAELPALFRQLDTTAALMRGARRPGGGGGGGSKTPPIPPRLDVLALVGPGGLAARLQAIEDSWRLALGRRIEVHHDKVRVFASWRSNPAAAVPGHATFLKMNLQRACESYESVGQDIEEIRRLHAECAALVAGERRPGRVQIGCCPVRGEGGYCGTQLTATAASHRVRCGGCGARWETLGEWRELRAAQDAVAAEQRRQKQEEVAA